jgi:photosystem II stability/assembly factor-like uncharacterized protein
MKKLMLLLFLIIFNSYLTTAQWQQTNVPHNFCHALAVNESNIFAGTNNGIFLSSNNGSSWAAANNGLTNTDVTSFAISGANIFAGTAGGGVFLSNNNGSSWTAINIGLIDSVVISLAVSGPNIFAGTWHSGVFLSTNNGSSWTAVNNGLTHSDIYSLSVSGPNILAGAGSGGVFLSTNNGSNWTAVGFFCDLMGDTVGVISLATVGQNIFAGTNGCGMFFSSNNGSSWTAINNGLINNYTGGPIYVIPSLITNGTNIFAGTFSGVYLSQNNGSSWTAVNDGFNTHFDWIGIESLIISESKIIAGTDTVGVWMRELSEIIGINEIGQNNSFSLYPNPITSFSTLRINTTIKNGEVIVYDMLGKEIIKKPINDDKVELEKGNIESGIYFVTVRNNERQFSQKVIIK